jgi:hypothetical protein
MGLECSHEFGHLRREGRDFVDVVLPSRSPRPSATSGADATCSPSATSPTSGPSATSGPAWTPRTSLDRWCLFWATRRHVLGGPIIRKLGWSVQAVTRLSFAAAGFAFSAVATLDTLSRIRATPDVLATRELLEPRRSQASGRRPSGLPNMHYSPRLTTSLPKPTKMQNAEVFFKKKDQLRRMIPFFDAVAELGQEESLLEPLRLRKKPSRHIAASPRKAKNSARSIDHVSSRAAVKGRKA